MNEHDRDFNVLLVEDEPGDAALIRRLLRNTGFGRFAVNWVTSLTAAKHELERGNYDLLLLDLSLPDTQGTATVKAGCAAAAHLPVVVLTGHDDREFALEALDLGASDYLVKGSFDEDNLIRALRYALARARTESALKESAASLNATLNATADGILAVDVKGGVLFFNQLFARLWQIPPAILASGEDRALLDYVLGQLSDPAAFLQEVERLYASAETSFDVLHFKDGRVFERYSFPLQRGVALPPGRVWSFRDITERRQAEEALLHSEKKLKAAFEGSHDAIITMSITGQLLDCNHRALELFGLDDREQFMVNGPGFFSPPHQPDGRDSAAAMEEYYSEAVKKVGFLRFEWLYRRQDGSTFPAEVSLTSYTLGKTVVLQANINDTTERKEYEAKLKYLSLHDALTDLYNRAFFDAELHRLCGSREYPVTIIVADLDGLKLVNDTLGHAGGDALLKACAAVLKKSLRAYDLLARIGGDEFAAILLRTTASVGEKVLSRMRAMGKAHNQKHQELPLHFSLGVATAETAAVSLQDVYKKADELMYRDKLARKESVRSHTVYLLQAALKKRDYLASGHCDRLSRLCMGMGEKMNMTHAQLIDLLLLVQLHDLGKVAVPDEIIFKVGPLADEEWELMRQHPAKGYQIAISSPELAELAPLILKHHEHWDGRGYPQGLKGEEIPLECRIFALADAFEVMTSGRPYSKAKSEAEAHAELKRCAGTQFDPGLVDLFISITTCQKGLKASQAISNGSPKQSE